ncbi:Polyadenylate-binding protein 1-like [Orobanche minor]
MASHRTFEFGDTDGSGTHEHEEGLLNKHIADVFYLYVGHLRPNVTHDLLCEVFGRHCKLTDAYVCRDPAQQALGYGYVAYYDERDAAVRAQESLNTSYAMGEGEGDIILKGLDESIEDDFFHHIFSVCGKIICCHILIDETTSRSKGIGFVNCDDEDAVWRAVAHFKGMTLGNKEVHVELTLSKAAVENSKRSDKDKHKEAAVKEEKAKKWK